MKMSKDYLSDTNFATNLFVTSRTDHQKANLFLQKVRDLGGRIYLSRIAIAEVEYGLALNPSVSLMLKQQMENGIKAYQVKDIGKHTTPHYAKIRAELFDKKAPRDKKGKIKRGLSPEQFTALKPTAYEFGIQENDLWIAAIAVELNMTLVTGDKMNQLKSVFPALNLENWMI